MQIGVLGSGDVAKVLAAGFHKHGHTVKIGSRNPEKLASWTADHKGIAADTFAGTASFAEAVVLAVKGTAAQEALQLAGAKNLAGKPVMDATNPIADAPPVNGVLQFFTGPNESLMEKLQAEFPDAHLVKAFNSVGNMRMVDPQYSTGRPTMFICGNDQGAKQKVRPLIEELGWDVADMGKAEAARAIEPLCMLWCIPVFTGGQATHAFKMLVS